MNLSENDVVITGVGPVTSIGVGHDPLWAALKEGRSHVQVRTLPVDLGRMVDLPIAAMPPTADVAGLDTHMAFLASQECEGYRDVAYALLAIELALADARIEYDRNSNTIGVIQAFEAPGAERTVSRLFELLQTPLPAGPPPVYDLLSPYFYNMQPFLYVHLVGKAFGFHGFSTSVHHACSSAMFAIELAAKQIRSGQADVMIVVGGEAFDTGVRLEWFRRLELYAPDERMRPFDAQPSGFFVGEGAAAMVLESASSAQRRGATPYAQYLGGAFAHQGWKQVIPDIRASRLSEVITNAMIFAGVLPEQLDLIVPHGAGTQLSDGYEASCLSKALLRGDSTLASGCVATAFKPYVGHMLAASAAIDLICTLLAVKHQAIPATLHTTSSKGQLPVPLADALMQKPARTVLKLATGFTGHDAALLLRAPSLKA